MASEDSALNILVIHNQALSLLSLNTFYNISIDSRLSFYEISFGLCIGLGIMVILLISLLCVLHYKYQLIKEENITLNLVKGADDGYK